MNLLLLAPEVQEAVLVGNLYATERALRSVLAISLWTDQVEHVHSQG